MDIPVNPNPYFLSQIGPVLPIGGKMVQNPLNMGLIPPHKLRKGGPIRSVPSLALQNQIVVREFFGLHWHVGGCRFNR
jgi:hypothetical protein